MAKNRTTGMETEIESVISHLADEVREAFSSGSTLEIKIVPGKAAEVNVSRHKEADAAHGINNACENLKNQYSGIKNRINDKKIKDACNVMNNSDSILNQMIQCDKDADCSDTSDTDDDGLCSESYTIDSIDNPVEQEYEEIRRMLENAITKIKAGVDMDVSVFVCYHHDDDEDEEYPEMDDECCGCCQTDDRDSMNALMVELVMQYRLLVATILDLVNSNGDGLTKKDVKKMIRKNSADIIDAMYEIKEEILSNLESATGDVIKSQQATMSALSAAGKAKPANSTPKNQNKTASKPAKKEQSQQ